MTTCRQIVQNFRCPGVCPATDLVERDDGFYLYLDMPGVRKEEIVVEVDGAEMTVQACTHFGCADSEYILAFEFGDVEYRAQFTLFDMVDRAGIAAHFSDGVLTIYLPRYQKSTPRKLRISVL